MLVILVSHSRHTDDIAESGKVDGLHLHSTEEVENEVFNQLMLLRILPEIALEKEHRLLTNLTLPLNLLTHPYLHGLERVDRFVVQHAELNHIEQLVIKEASHDQILRTLFRVASHHKQTAIVLLGEELERIHLVKGTNIVFLGQHSSKRLLQAELAHNRLVHNRLPNPS